VRACVRVCVCDEYTHRIVCNETVVANEYKNTRQKIVIVELHEELLGPETCNLYYCNKLVDTTDKIIHASFSCTLE